MSLSETIEQVVAKLNHRIYILEQENTSLRGRVKVLTAYYDKQEGTPCEQIRHHCVVEDLKRQIIELQHQVIANGIRTPQ